MFNAGAQSSLDRSFALMRVWGACTHKSEHSGQLVTVNPIWFNKLLFYEGYHFLQIFSLLTHLNSVFIFNVHVGFIEK